MVSLIVQRLEHIQTLEKSASDCKQIRLVSQTQASKLHRKLKTRSVNYYKRL